MSMVVVSSSRRFERPEPVSAQRQLALDRANQIRMARAAKKADLAVMTCEESVRAVSRLLERPPVWALSWPVADVLRCARSSRYRRVQRSWVASWLREANITGLSQLSQLTARQRRVLVAALARFEETMRGA